MFGFRPDGRRKLRDIDPIVQFTPYIMPTRVDAQNFCKQLLDYDALAAYIKEKREQGINISFMSIVIAAFVRTASQHPELNRFVMNKQIYARNRLSVSFVVLREREDEKDMESLAKVDLKYTDTIFEVNQKIEQAIEKGRQDQQNNLTDVFARTLLAVPGLATLVVALARLLDRYGLLPDLIYRASPFHTSLFITNMASINFPYIYHHLYNFGTTSIFVSLGKLERTLRPTSGGKVGYKYQLPLGIVTDERICGGASYARAFAEMRKYLNDPASMELPPESVRYETEMLYMKQERKCARRERKKIDQSA